MSEELCWLCNGKVWIFKLWFVLFYIYNHDVTLTLYINWTVFYINWWKCSSCQHCTKQLGKYEVECLASQKLNHFTICVLVHCLAEMCRSNYSHRHTNTIVFTISQGSKELTVCHQWTRWSSSSKQYIFNHILWQINILLVNFVVQPTLQYRSKPTYV